MIDTKQIQQLRALGYSANESGIICHRTGKHRDRYLHERCGILKIDLEHDFKGGRELVEKLLAVIDEPRSIVGRARNGSAVVLFKAGEFNVEPTVNNGGQKGVFDLALKATGELVTITCASEGQTLDPTAYTWAKVRSPYDVPRDALALLFDDIGSAVVKEAFDLDMTWASLVPTPEELAEQNARHAIALAEYERTQYEADLKLLADVPDDVKLSVRDGDWAVSVLAARERMAERKSQAVEAA
jgi:hypothetical protein